MRTGSAPAALDYAAEYLRRGVLPIPLAPRDKRPLGDGWQRQRPTADDLPRLFPPGADHNLGILLGRPSGGLVDVDLDCPEARAAVDVLLPATGWVFGRASAPRSHRLYFADDPGATAQYRAPDGAMLVEHRSTGGQSMAPPSMHPSGEAVEWAEYGEPARVAAADLRAAVARVAAATLLARHWPKQGGRQDAALALAGGLARDGWEEADAERLLRAVALAAGDDEPAMRCNTVGRTKRKVDAGEKATGWPTLAKELGENGNAVVAKVHEWLGVRLVFGNGHAETPPPDGEAPSAEPAAPADVPVPQAPPWPAPPADEAFHGLAGEVVRAIEPASEADSAALLIQTLVAFGNVVGRSPHFVVEGDRHHANEFAVLIGRTGKGRKGTSWGRVAGLFAAAAPEWAAGCVKTGLSSGEGLAWAVRDPIVKRKKGKDMEVDAGVADKRLLGYEPEFGNVLAQTVRQGNTLSAQLRVAWDGRDMGNLTKNMPAVAKGAHVSEVGHVTAEELRRDLTATQTANGFGNRHLWLCVQRSKVLPEGGAIDPSLYDMLRDGLAQALAFGRAAGQVRRDDGARELWHAIYEELSEGRPGLAGALLSRGEAHVMRLAMIYALMDRSPAIPAEHLTAALALWQFCERSVYFVFGDALGDPLADDLLRLLRASPKGLTRNDLTNHLGRHQSAEHIGLAMGLLLQHKLARCERQDTGGRPAERWFATARG